MAIKLLWSFFAQEMPSGPPIPLTDDVKNAFVLEFAAAEPMILPSDVLLVIDTYQSGDLEDHPARSTEPMYPDEPRPSQLWLPGPDAPPPGTPGDMSPVFQLFLDVHIRAAQSSGYHIAETESNQSNEAEVDDENKPAQDQNLMNLLYRIAEDQAKKEGFVHRGVNCDSCNAMPIRGIRYRCNNCHDYDLCEQCESLQVHDKTHLFTKIRIPAPFLGHPRGPAPVWYPGNPGKVNRNLTAELRTMLATKTGIQDRQVDAYWEQFQCLASCDFPADPSGFRVAIDRRDFNKCFVPSSAPRPPPPNLLYDRIFSFYDTNNDGLIGFEEFLSGIACVENKGSSLRARIFRAYDIDGDGFVTRKDFLRMFRAYYALTKDLTAQVVSDMDDEFFDEDDAREIIQSSQPISSIFSGAIPPGEPSRRGMGKSLNRNGDMDIVDGQGFLRETVEDADGEPNHELLDKIVADHAEYEQFGSIRSSGHRCKSPTEVLEVEDDQWPKAWLVPQDFRDALGDRNPQESITEHFERSLVVCAGIERIQQEYWNRTTTRRRAVQDRWAARQFYLEGQTVDRPFLESSYKKSLSGNNPYPDTDIRSLRIKVLDRTKRAMNVHWFFHEDVTDEVRAQWPDYTDLAGISHTFQDWIKEGRKCYEMAQDLAPTRADIPKAGFVVCTLLQTIIAVDSGQWRSRNALRASPAMPSPASKRSRSSSKVRFEDDPVHENDQENRSNASISSRNIPVGERWGGSEIPGPEIDVGREMIYQITLEGMNELLDPMFKLRENVAIAVIKTRWERRLRQEEIKECMRSNFVSKAMTAFRVYQKRWYQASRDSQISNLPNSALFVQVMLRCLKEPNSPGSRLSRLDLGRNEEDQDVDITRLREATDAIIRLDQTVANEVSGEILAASAEPKQVISDPPSDAIDVPIPADNEGNRDSEIQESLETEVLQSLRRQVPANNDDLAVGDLLRDYSAVGVELREGVAAFDGADDAKEQSTKETPLELLLADAGYGVVTPPIQDFEWSSASSISSPARSVDGHGVQEHVDRTLPQYRPDSVDEWEAKYGNLQDSIDDGEDAQQQRHGKQPAMPEPRDLPPLSYDRLLTLALWTVIEDDDRQRGGPGRLNFSDFTLIMQGDKGEGLGFVSSWVETAAF
ncbi:MAG: hypothetical protein L6R40_000344 [Gallowayella cf. fulva]|nr:MAG: hypothetical protein L6R40_000344 [Xanthomendoza cf. fulva]